MIDRTVPCSECRKSRRKCIPTLSKCLRCERFEKKCTHEVIFEEEEEEEEDNDIVDDLQNQVIELEIAFKQVEIQLQGLSCRSNNNSPNNRIQNLIHQWKVQLENGTFKIDTGIKNISDLMSFQSNNISYLSPYANGDMMIQFSCKSTKTLVPFTLRLLTQCVRKVSHSPDTLDLPNNLNLDTLVMTIDQIVEIYFNCHNAYTPLLHKSSFMDRYKQLDNPEDDLLSLSICAHVCASPCDHIQYIPSERRKLADYFFKKAKLIILDQFDLPEKRLENVMAINLCSKYMHMTLKYGECRQLIAIAYQLCIDLNLDSTTQDELHQVLCSRHITMTAYVNRFMNYISSYVSYDAFLTLPDWKYMQDESEEIKQYIKAQNWLLSLYNHAFVVNFLKEIHKVHLGQECALSFESLLRIEEVISDWSKQAPDGYCLCGDLNNIESCVEGIDSTSDCVLLMSFIHYQAFIVSIYSSLLQPIALGNDHNQLLSFIQQSSLEKSLKAGQLLIHAVNRISIIAEGTSLCYYKLAACDFLFHAINVLLLLALSNNSRVSRESRIILKTCLDDVIKVRFMQEQCVPTNSALISKTIDFSDESAFDFEHYDEYSQPWFAMVYDVSYYIASLQ